ncbi:MAG: hypothetical protein JWN34_5404 [Bryobacterales bacterium]|nr:hypothetical protein [Bryobacterales bacterium]
MACANGPHSGRSSIDAPALLLDCRRVGRAELAHYIEFEFPAGWVSGRCSFGFAARYTDDCLRGWFAGPCSHLGTGLVPGGLTFSQRERQERNSFRYYGTRATSCRTLGLTQGVLPFLGLGPTLHRSA